MTETDIQKLASLREAPQQAAIAAWLEYLQSGAPFPEGRSPDFTQFSAFLKEVSAAVKNRPDSIKLRGRLVMALSAYRDLASSWASDRTVKSHGANRKLRQHYYEGREDVIREVLEELINEEGT